MIKRYLAYCAAALAAFVITACGGAGGGASSVPTALPTTPPTAADITIVGVPTDPNTTTVSPGEIGKEVFAARVLATESTTSPIGQVVLKVTSTVPLSKFVKRVRLMANGIDLNSQTFYTVQLDETKSEILITFPNPVALDTVGVPSTYSVVLDIGPTVASGTTLTVELAGVQPRDFGVSVAIQNAKGRQFTVAGIPGQGLAKVASTSPAFMSFTSDVIGGDVPLGSFDATCPATNIAPCILMSVTYAVFGTTAPSLFVDGLVFGSNPGDSPDFGFGSDIGIAINPGETKTFFPFGVAIQTDILVIITGTTWSLGTDGKTYNPIGPTEASACGSILDDGTNIAICNVKG
jgi:hypothetical protein